MKIQRVRRLLPLQEFLYDAVVLVFDLMQYLAGLRSAQFRHVRAVLLGITDLFQDRLEACIVKFQLKLLVDLAQDRFLLLAVDDLKLLIQKQLFRIFPQQPVAESVIGADQARVVPISDQRTDPAPHLASRLIGKCHAQDIEGIDAVLLHEIGITAHEKLRLAAPRPRDHPDIPFCLEHRFPLFFIQVIQ